MNRCRRDSVAILRMRVCTHMFPGLLCLIYLTLALRHPIDTLSILTAVQDQIQLPIPHLLKRTILGKNYIRNSEFTLFLVQTFFISVSIAWLSILLLRSGDIQPHPGPSSVSSSDNSFNNLSSMSASILSSASLARHLSFVHYNVQSIKSKLDILASELSEFDILAFSETWLSATTPSSDLYLPSFKPPERKDRLGDNYGGVMLYVKQSLYYRRRRDLEPIGLECLWIELILKQKHVLFGLFYRPPNSDSLYYNSIEDSLHLAIDTGISDIIITGDFNFNLLNEETARKITSLCAQFSLSQCINDYTHYTEHSSTLIDILLVSNNKHLIASGVAEPFLEQDIRFHCPIFGIFNFAKPKFKSYLRHVWIYSQGDYNLLRAKASSFDWTSIQNTDINQHAKNISDTILSLSKSCIPNKFVRIRPSEPPWMTTRIKQQIRKRKRAFRRAKQTKTVVQWAKFKRIRNNVVSLIRESKRNIKEKLSTKLKSQPLSSRDWWRTLKTFISSDSKSKIPPLRLMALYLQMILTKRTC